MRNVSIEAPDVLDRDHPAALPPGMDTPVANARRLAGRRDLTGYNTIFGPSFGAKGMRSGVSNRKTPAAPAVTAQLILHFALHFFG